MNEIPKPSPEFSPPQTDTGDDTLPEPNTQIAKEVPERADAPAAAIEPDQSESSQAEPAASPSIPNSTSITTPTMVSGRPTAVDIWSTRLAAWAQIVTVFVVIFGYFYTVKPAFQLQLLQEQTAQLQLDGDAAKKKLATTLVAQEHAEANLAKLNAELVVLAKSRDSLTAELNRESQREFQAMQKMAIAQTQLSSQTETLLLAQRRLLYTRFLGFFFWGLRWGFPPSIENDDEDGRSFVKAQTAWPNLYYQISTAIDALEKDNETRHEFPADLVRPLRRTLEEKKADLVCETLPVESLSREYREEMGNVDAESKKDAIAELNKQRAAALTRKAQLIVTDDDVDRFTRSYRVSRVYSIRGKYEDKLSTLWNACTSKGKVVVDVMSKQI